MADLMPRDHLMDLIRGRRTINFYKPDPVPREILEEAIDVARWAPNHRKTEPWRFHLLGPVLRQQTIDLITQIKSAGQGGATEMTVRKRLDEIPGWLVLTTERSPDPLMDRENYAACCCAAQNLMLCLWHAGIGTKWTTGEVTRDPRFHALLGLNHETTAVAGLFWYGYPQQIPTQTRGDLGNILIMHD